MGVEQSHHSDHRPIYQAATRAACHFEPDRFFDRELSFDDRVDQYGKFFIQHSRYTTYDDVVVPLIHNVQVAVLARELVASAEVDHFLAPEHTSAYARHIAETRGLDHDARFAILGSLHPVIGSYFFDQVMNKFGGNGYTEEIEMARQFSLDHHRFGMGISRNGQSRYALFDENSDNSELIQQLDEKYSAGGLAVIVSDNSKIRKDSRYPHLSSIHPFSPELGHINITHQLQKGAFSEGSRRHQEERAGIKLVSHIIDYLECNYGAKYEESVQEAQELWPYYEQKIEDLWDQWQYQLLCNTAQTLDIMTSVRRAGNTIGS